VLKTLFPPKRVEISLRKSLSDGLPSWLLCSSSARDGPPSASRRPSSTTSLRRYWPVVCRTEPSPTFSSLIGNAEPGAESSSGLRLFSLVVGDWLRPSRFAEPVAFDAFKPINQPLVCRCSRPVALLVTGVTFPRDRGLPADSFEFPPSERCFTSSSSSGIYEEVRRDVSLPANRRVFLVLAHRRLRHGVGEQPVVSPWRVVSSSFRCP